MRIIVLLKRVPNTTEEELTLSRDGRSIREEQLAFALNEWDAYALEEAISLKESQGGSVTAITIGPEEAKEVLRRALAMGADEAVHLYDEALQGSDGGTLARILARFLNSRPFDLILTGVMASDVADAQVGPALARMLKVPWATLVTRLEIVDGGLLIHRELEGGWEERLKIPLPCLLTIQTGINEPRYVSILGIRKVRGIPISEQGLEKLGLEPQEVGEAGSLTRLVQLALPPTTEGGEILSGSLEEISDRIYALLREKGGVA
jgi:electron transfer flavoprotein beta subunit